MGATHGEAHPSGTGERGGSVAGEDVVKNTAVSAETARDKQYIDKHDECWRERQGGRALFLIGLGWDRSTMIELREQYQDGNKASYPIAFDGSMKV
jgi:hypothetical protein